MPDRNDAYYARMRLILRWRRIASLFCVFLALYAVTIVWRSPAPMPRGSILLVQSLLIFAVAALIAVNLMTVRLRRSPAQPRS